MINSYPEGVGFEPQTLNGGSAGGTAHFRMLNEANDTLKDYGSTLSKTRGPSRQVHHFWSALTTAQHRRAEDLDLFRQRQCREFYATIKAPAGAKALTADP
jgi:hypothetical protein